MSEENGSYALRLLTDAGNRKKAFLTDIWSPLLCGTLGFGAACFVNFGTRRPIFSGIQKHALYTVIGVTVGKVLDEWRTSHLAERDAVLRHYVELHPDDFPNPERKKYSELLLKWTPIR